MNENTKINPNGLAIFNALKEASAPLAFIELANLAGVEAKTGYLTSAKKIAAENGKRIEKVKDAVTVKFSTVTVYTATGLTVEKEKETAVDGYILADAE